MMRGSKRILPVSSNEPFVSFTYYYNEYVPLYK